MVAHAFSPNTQDAEVQYIQDYHGQHKGIQVIQNYIMRLWQSIEWRTTITKIKQSKPWVLSSFIQVSTIVVNSRFLPCLILALEFLTVGLWSGYIGQINHLQLTLLLVVFITVIKRKPGQAKGYSPSRLLINWVANLLYVLGIKTLQWTSSTCC